MGNWEKRIKATAWDAFRDMPNVNHINGEGQWHVFPCFKRLRNKLKIKIFNKSPLKLTNARGPPYQSTKLSIIFVIILFVMLMGTIFAFGQETYTLSGNITDPVAGIGLDSVLLKLFTADSIVQDSSFSDNGNYSLTMTVTETDPLDMPSDFNISAYPNPVNPSTIISFNISEAGNYTIESFDLSGRKLSTFNRYFEAGQYQTSYGGTNTASGMQLIRIFGEDYNKTVKVTFLDGGNGSGFGIISCNTNINKSLKKTMENIDVLLTADKEGHSSYDTLLTLYPSDENTHNFEMDAYNHPVYFNGHIVSLLLYEDSTMIFNLEALGFGDYDNDEWTVEILGLNDNALYVYDSLTKELSITGKQDYNGLLEDIVIKVSDEKSFAESNAFD
ncbi:MAG: T9SS type A sorting domain-containing protein, partial [Candidatus Marinimicrobia bacterium]|nr:T9SS type A sorting domain-containing protein [Candidatus Neomarinimicrobiota bacterium]